MLWEWASRSVYDISDYTNWNYVIKKINIKENWKLASKLKYQNFVEALLFKESIWKDWHWLLTNIYNYENVLENPENLIITDKANVFPEEFFDVIDFD